MSLKAVLIQVMMCCDYTFTERPYWTEKKYVLPPPYRVEIKEFGRALLYLLVLNQGSTVGAAVRALTSHLYGPEFDSRTQHHMCVEFVGSLLRFKGFSPGSPVFLPLQKPTLIQSRLCSMTRHESYGCSQRRPCMPSTLSR